MYYSEKKTKYVEEKILAKKEKNENEICPCAKENKLKDRERQCKRRKNIQKICLRKIANL